MSEKRIIAGLSTLILMTMFVAPGQRSQAQSLNPNTVNLSGAWELVEYNGTKKTQNPERFPRLNLLITQEGSEIRITWKRTIRGLEQVREYLLNADGRGETNTGNFGLFQPSPSRYQSVSEWQRGKLVTRYDSAVLILTSSSSKGNSDYRPVNSDTQRKDQWSLSTDGKRLKLTIASVRMNSSSGGAHLAPGGFRDSPSNESQSLAPYADFASSKFVFSRN